MILKTECTFVGVILPFFFSYFKKKKTLSFSKGFSTQSFQTLHQYLCRYRVWYLQCRYCRSVLPDTAIIQPFIELQLAFQVITVSVMRLHYTVTEPLRDCELQQLLMFEQRHYWIHINFILKLDSHPLVCIVHFFFLLCSAG